jgi:hypothetical protein
MAPRRLPAALLLAALAVLGILRVPCLVTVALRAQAADLPACHGGPDAGKDAPASCTQCASLHGLVAPACAAAAPDDAPAALGLAAPGWRPPAAQRPDLTLFGVGSPRAPDALRDSTVRLL